MHDDRSNSARRRPLASFAAAFAGVFLLGGVVVGVQFFETHRKPVPAPAVPAAAQRPVVDQRLGLETKFRQARDRVGEARRQANAAEMAVFQFLNGWFVEASTQPNVPPAPKPAAPIAAPVRRPNPEWVELNQQLTEMQQKRAELLTKLTPAHPTMLALDSQLADKRDLLSAVPADLPVEVNATQVEQSEEHDAVATLAASRQSSINRPSPEVQQEYRKLLLAAGRSRENYRAAIDGENMEWKIFRRGGELVIALDRSGVVDLRGAGQDSVAILLSNRPFPIGAVAVLTLLSTFAGALAARKAGRRTLTFKSIAEIEATLGLPVLGRLGPESRVASKDAA